MGILRPLVESQRELIHRAIETILTPREVDIVAAYMTGEPLSLVCKVYETSPAAIGMLMAARYGSGRIAEANARAVSAAIKSRRAAGDKVRRN